MEGYGGWYHDFWRLSTERQIGMGIGPIPASAIDRHTQGWLIEDADMFEHCIREMDRVYLVKENSRDGTSAPPSDLAPSSPRDAFRSATSGRRG